MNGPREKNRLEVAAVKVPPLYGNLEPRDMYSVPLRGRITQATAGHTNLLAHYWAKEREHYFSEGRVNLSYATLFFLYSPPFLSSSQHVQVHFNMKLFSIKTAAEPCHCVLNEYKAKTIGFVQIKNPKTMHYQTSIVTKQRGHLNGIKRSSSSSKWGSAI